MNLDEFEYLNIFLTGLENEFRKKKKEKWRNDMKIIPATSECDVVT